MSYREKVKKELEFQVPGKNECYERPIYWKDIIATEGILPTDQYAGMRWKTVTQPKWMAYDENETETFVILMIKIWRMVDETDEEYFARMKKTEDQKRQAEERERLEWLRLKAKFEDAAKGEVQS